MSESNKIVQRYTKNMCRTMVLSLSLVIAVTGVLFAIDFVFGYMSSISTVRDSAQKFRSESARMSIRTRNLVPNVDHAYDLPHQAGNEGSGGAPRVFRTDMNGNIKSGRNFRGEPAAKVLFLGGSTTESNEVDESFRFPALVEELLNDHYLVPVEVWNGGVRSHTTVDSINLLLNNGVYAKATHVVLMHNINDRLLLAAQDGYQSKLGTSGDTSWDKVREAGVSLSTAVMDFVSYHSNLLFAARMYFARFHPFSGEAIGNEVTADTIDLQDQNIEQHVLVYRAYMEVFISISKALNKVPILMTQPLGRLSKGQSRFNEVLQEVAFKHQVRIIDLERLLPPDREELFLSDAIHMNNEGGKVLGHIIAGDLSEILGSKVPRENYPAPIIR